MSENTPSGVDIGNPVAATDENTSDTLTYTLRSADAEIFDIIEDSGQIQTKAELNHESRRQYTVVVTATDPSGLFDTQQVTINVGDVDEPPVITGPDEVTYGQHRTDTVARYQAVDPERAVTTWDLVGTHSGEFDFTNGVLTFKDQPLYDPNGNNEYFVTVRATDQTGNAGELQVVVTVTESGQPPPTRHLRRRRRRQKRQNPKRQNQRQRNQNPKRQNQKRQSRKTQIRK